MAKRSTKKADAPETQANPTPKIIELSNITPTKQERAAARASDKAARSNKKASRMLEDWENAGGSASGISMSEILRVDSEERSRAAIQKFMAEPSSKEQEASRKSTAKNRRAAKFIGLKPGDPQLTSQGLAADPEAGRSVAATKLGGEVPVPAKRGGYHKGPRSDSPERVQARILSEGTAEEYWKHVDEHGAFSGLGATRGGKPVSGFCTNCDNPVFRADIEPAITGKEGQQINTRAAGGLTRPIDDSLCDTCQPHAGVVTAAGQAALQEKFNVARGERG